MKSTWDWIDFLTAYVAGEKSNVIYNRMLLNENIFSCETNSDQKKASAAEPSSPSRHEKLINHLGANMVRLYI